MGTVQRLWARLVTLQANIVIAGAMIVGAFGFLSGFASQIGQFPWYSKVLLGIAVLLVIFLVITRWEAILRWINSPSSGQPAGPSQVSIGPQFVHAPGGISGTLQMEGNQMMVGSQFPPAHALPPMPATIDLLTDRARQLDELCTDLEQFAIARRAEYDAYEVPFGWDEPRRKMSDQSRENQREHDRETVRLYVQTFSARVGELYADVRQYGFPNQQIEMYLTFQPMGIVMVQKIAVHLREVALAIRRRLADLESPAGGTAASG
jgi:hypothetical protein